MTTQWTDEELWKLANKKIRDQMDSGAAPGIAGGVAWMEVAMGVRDELDAANIVAAQQFADKLAQMQAEAQGLRDALDDVTGTLQTERAWMRQAYADLNAIYNANGMAELDLLANAPSWLKESAE